MKFLIIDNYDSFVYNIAQRLGELGVSSDVIRNDKITINEIKDRNYDAIVISPGPGTPEDKRYFGICKPSYRKIILVIASSCILARSKNSFLLIFSSLNIETLVWNVCVVFFRSSWMNSNALPNASPLIFAWSPEYTKNIVKTTIATPIKITAYVT